MVVSIRRKTYGSYMYPTCKTNVRNFNQNKDSNVHVATSTCCRPTKNLLSWMGFLGVFWQEGIHLKYGKVGNEVFKPSKMSQRVLFTNHLHTIIQNIGEKNE